MPAGGHVSTTQRLKRDAESPLFTEPGPTERLPTLIHPHHPRTVSFIRQSTNFAMSPAESSHFSAAPDALFRDAEEGRISSATTAQGPPHASPSRRLSTNSVSAASGQTPPTATDPSRTSQPHRVPSRSGAFGDRPPRTALSEKAKGKQRASSEHRPSLLFPGLVQSPEDEDGPVSPVRPSSKTARRTGRAVTIIFSGEEDGTSEGNLDIWVEDGESIGSVKDQASLAIARQSEY